MLWTAAKSLDNLPLLSFNVRLVSSTISLPPSLSPEWLPHPSTGLHEFSYRCLPSWQVLCNSFEKKNLSTTISRLAAFCSSRQITAKPIFLGCHCGFVAGKEFTTCLGCNPSTGEHSSDTGQRKLGHGNPLPIASSHLWMTLSDP